MPERRERRDSRTLKIRIVNAICRLLDSILRLGGARLHDHVIGYLSSMVPRDGPGPGLFDIRILLPPAAEPDAQDLPIVERIFAAYRKARKDQAEAEPVFLPSSLWRHQLDDSCAELIAGGERNEIGRFHRFLANFGASERYTGISYSSMVREHATSR